MTELAAIALRLNRLPSEIEQEEPDVIDEMVRLLHRADNEPSPVVADSSDLAARMAGR